MEHAKLRRAGILRQLGVVVDVKKGLEPGSVVDDMKTTHLYQLLEKLCTIEGEVRQTEGYYSLRRDEAVDLAKMYYELFVDLHEKKKRKLSDYYARQLDEVAAKYHLKEAEYAF